MELYGNWSGIGYYQKLKDFILENDMRLSILMGSESGNLRATLTEVCELPGRLDGSGWTEPLIQKCEYQLTGTFNKDVLTLKFTGEYQEKGFVQRRCLLELKLNEEEEKLTGVFRNPEAKDDVQVVELFKGDERRDLLEHQERGRLFLEEIIKREAEELEREGLEEDSRSEFEIELEAEMEAELEAELEAGLELERRAAEQLKH